MAGQAEAQLIQNSILFQGHYYAALDCTPPRCANVGTQIDFIKLPATWSLVPPEAEVVEHVVANYPWGTYVMIFQDGSGFLTPIFSTPGMEHGKGTCQLRTADKSYRPKAANNRILIRKAALQSQFDFCPDRRRADVCAKLWTNRQFCDCEVQCGEHVIECHCAVLASCSTVFERMLKSEMQEGRLKQVVIHDAEPRVVEALLKFMYTGECILDADIVLPLLGLADCYQIDDLVKICAKSALERATVDRIVPITRSLRAVCGREELEWIIAALIDIVSDDRALLSKALREL
eukprot:TRINITY_DN60214_c0_g1_i1.p1 TRINITY_DN60214_c0_g1~~TRINITY_DN60214_c0_g1_i1.p1  ORF type:complete len:291 (-),score=42.67 TRINITY_DN60214_c0_g1_i1:229-1101(-)